MNAAKPLALAALGLAAASLHAQATLSLYAGAYAATGISRDGGLVVGSGPMNFILRPDGGFTDIGGNPIGQTYSGIVKVAADGSAIVGSSTPAGGLPQLARYDVASGVWTPYGSLGYHTSSGTMQESNGWGISGDGNTLVGQAYYNTTALGGTAARVDPIVARASGVTDLFPSTTGNGRAQGANFDGTVVGGYSGAASSTGAVWSESNGVWTQESVVVNYNGGTFNGGAVQAISADGRWVVGDNLASGIDGQAYISDRLTGTGRVIPRLDSFVANTRGFAFGVSDNGGKVIGRYNSTQQNPVNYYGTIWTPSGGTMLLDDYATSLGVDMTGLHIYNPTAISGDGSTIAGTLFDSSTNTSRMFVLRAPTPVPEPATLAALTLGAAALLRKRRRA